MAGENQVTDHPSEVGEGQAGPSAETIAREILAPIIEEAENVRMPYGVAKRLSVPAVTAIIAAALRASEAALGLTRRNCDALADEVDVLIRRKIIDSRSPAADALLDFREPPSSERSDRLAVVEAALAEARERFQASENLRHEGSERETRWAIKFNEARAEATKAERERAANLVHAQRCYPYHAAEGCPCLPLDIAETDIRKGEPDPAIRAPRPPCAYHNPPTPSCADGSCVHPSPLSTEHGQGSGVDAKPSEEPPKHRAWCRESWGGTQKCECAVPSPAPPREEPR